MLKKSILTLLVMTILLPSLKEAGAGFPAPPGLPGLPAPNVNVSVNGYLPAPPGVSIMIDSGRPYYVERDRRVYLERETGRHTKKHRRHHRKHDHDHGEHGR